MLWTPLGARALRMACVTAGVTGNRAQAPESRGVALIVHQRPCAIERGGAEKIGTPSDDIAGRVANAAADAFDARIRGDALTRSGIDAREIIAARAFARELAFCARPFVEEVAHVGHEIANDRKVRERRD